MEGDLWSKPPLYTIDSCSLIDIFGSEKMVSKDITPGLWKKILELIEQGVIVSHIEVFQEIKKEGTKGEELYDWTHMNPTIFKDYDWAQEGPIIRVMSPKYDAFVNAKVGNIHADPWLIAQAKSRKITLITEEKFSTSPNVKKHKLPNVCSDPLFNVKSIDLVGLIKEQGWKFL
jgi:PIN domain nuclease of toxin-antitoxin system